MSGNRGPVEAHWMTSFDPDDGEPYGSACGCRMGGDHTSAEYRKWVADQEQARQEAEWTS